MTKTLTALAAAAAVAMATTAVPTPASAGCRGCGIGFGILGGAIVGAAIASSIRPGYAYDPGYYPVQGYYPYAGYGAAGPIACPGGYWARQPVSFYPNGQPATWSRPRWFCP